jgi:L-lactate dehydrogenase complex protein LldF
VRIPLHHQLLAGRGELARAGYLPRARRLGLGLAARVLARPERYRRWSALARRLARRLPAAWLERLVRPWTRQRALPAIPEHSFRDLYRSRIRTSPRRSR